MSSIPLFQLWPFRASHVYPLLEQPINARHKVEFLGGLAQWAEKQMGCFTGTIYGETMVCGGILPYWPGRGEVWTIFNEESKHSFVPVFRGIKDFLREQGKQFRRIEVAIPCDFEIGRRRAEMLGFKLECEYAEAYLPEGTDCAVYSLIQRES